MKKIDDLTLEEHRAYGLEFAVMRDRLVELHVIYSNAKKIDAYTTNNFRNAVTRIDPARNVLDNVVCRLYPDDDPIHIYYPAQQAREAFENYAYWKGFEDACKLPVEAK